MRALRRAALSAAMLASATRASAQDGAREVTGRVVRPGETTMVGVPNIWATLHRVGSDRAAPLDSQRTDRTGGFHFRYTPTGDTAAIYFVSASYGGIAYFTAPLRGTDVRGEDAEVAVFDTTSHPVPVTVRGRHLVVSAGDVNQRRSIVEVYEISNDSSVTRIAGEDRPVWTAPIPAAATDFRAAQTDVSAETITRRGDRVELYAPFAPGLRQISFSYSLPASAVPITAITEQPAIVLEVLVEDSAATVLGAGLRAVTPVASGGRVFRRYLAQDVPANQRVEINVPSGVVADPRAFVFAGTLGVIGIGLLGGLAYAYGRRRVPRARALAVPTTSRAARLAREIADLDTARETTSSPDAALDARRLELRRELEALLAAEDGRG